IVLMGLRTAGAYFVPLMAEYLKTQNRQSVSWFSIRPKNGISQWERGQLDGAVKDNARVLVVDDYPATGHTLRLTLETVMRLGVRAEQIAVLAPTHRAQPNWVQLARIDERIAIVTIQPEDLHKAILLSSDFVESLCTSYYETQGWEQARVLHDHRVDEIN